MKKLQKIISYVQKINPDIFWIIIGSIITLLILNDLFLLPKEWFIRGHDSDATITRAYFFHIAVQHGDFWPIWTQEYMSGYGYVFSLFYGKMPFFFIEAINYIKGDIIQSINIFIYLSFIFSGIFMYKILRFFFGNFASFCGAIVFIFFPYHMADIFMRMDLAEVTGSFLWAPALIWSILSYLKTNKKYYLLLVSLFLFFLINTHILSTIMWGVAIVLYLFLYIIFHLKQISSILQKYSWLLIAMIIGLLMSAIYLSSLLFERELVHTERLFIDKYRPEMHYVTDFISLKYFNLTEFKALGAHNLLKIYPLSLGIIILIMAGIWGTILACFSKKIFVKNKSQKLVINTWAVIITALAIFLIVGGDNATWVWRNIPGAHVLQFSWRLSVYIAFGSAIFCALIIHYLSQNKGYSRPLVLSLIATILWMGNSPYLEGTNWSEWSSPPSKNSKDPQNYAYIHAGKIHERVEGLNKIMAYSTDEAKEYLPKIVPTNIEQGIRSHSFISDKAQLKSQDSGSIKNIKPANIGYQNFEYFVNNTKEVQEVWIDHIYFPGWQVYINNEWIKTSYNREGMIKFELPSGESQVTIKLENSAVRLIGKQISFWAFLVWGFLGIVLMGVEFYPKKTQKIWNKQRKNKRNK